MARPARCITATLTHQKLLECLPPYPCPTPALLVRACAWQGPGAVEAQLVEMYAWGKVHGWEPVTLNKQGKPVPPLAPVTLS